VLKLTYGNVELKKCFGGVTPEPPFQGRDRRGRDGKEGKGRAEEGRGKGAGWVMGLSPPQSQIPRYVPVNGCQSFNMPIDSSRKEIVTSHAS